MKAASTNAKATAAKPPRAKGKRIDVSARPAGLTPRKSRSTGGLAANLTEEQRDLVFTWLAKENLTYREAIDRMRRQFDIAATKHLVCDFWHQWCAPRLVQRPTPAAAGNPIMEIRISIQVFASGQAVVNTKAA